MKKIISLVLVSILIFNFIFDNCAYVFASEIDSSEVDSVYGREGEIEGEHGDDVLELIEGGDVKRSENDSTTVQTIAASFGTSIIGFITGIISRIVDIIVLQIDLLMSQLTFTQIEDEGSGKDVNDSFWFTIDKTVFNRIALFNINYFDIPEENNATYKVGDTIIYQDANNLAIKRQVSKVYYICRMIALAISLVVLIYIGIRMSISTIASDQAKYKKMLTSWVESIIILFLMLYIISAVIMISDSLTAVFYGFRNDLFGKETPGSSNTYGVFEDTVRKSTLNLVLSTSGLQVTFWSIVYWFLLYMEFKFLWTYMKRFLMVGFLIIISPFIIVTYSIDKVGDNKAQAFSVWLKEFITSVLIQPLHALIYLIFVFSANSIAIEAPLVGIAMLFALTNVERMVKILFDIKDITILPGLDRFRKKG